MPLRSFALVSFLLAAGPALADDGSIVPCSRNLQDGRILVEDQYVKGEGPYKITHFAAVDQDGPVISKGKCEIHFDRLTKAP